MTSSPLEGPHLCVASAAGLPHRPASQSYEYTSSRWLIGLIRLWFRIFEIVFELSD